MKTRKKLKWLQCLGRGGGSDDVNLCGFLSEDSHCGQCGNQKELTSQTCGPLVGPRPSDRHQSAISPTPNCVCNAQDMATDDRQSSHLDKTAATRLNSLGNKANASTSVHIIIPYTVYHVQPQDKGSVRDCGKC